MSARICSVQLGSAKLTYETEKNSAESQAYTPQEPTKISKAHVTALNTASFSFGNETLSYATTNKMADPTGNMQKYTAHTSSEQKAALRVTNLSLGTAKAPMISAAQATNRFDQEASLQEVQSSLERNELIIRDREST